MLRRVALSARFANTENESSESIRRSFMRGAILMGLDVVIFLAVSITLYYMFSGYLIYPVERGFYCSDESIRSPLYPNTISTSHLLIVTLLSPFFIILACEAVLFHESKDSNRLGKFFVASTLIYLEYLLAYTAFTFLLESIKCAAGRLRPHFLAGCDPDWSNIDCVTDPYAYIQDYNCQGTPHRVRVSRTSFPSGHAGAAGFLFLYLYLYSTGIVGATRSAALTGIRKVLLTVSFMWMTVTAVTRVTDFWHFPTDVLGNRELDMTKKLTFNEAQKAFTDLLENVHPSDAPKFVHWISDTVAPGSHINPRISDARIRLHEISAHLRQQLPTSATLASEQILWPQVGYDSDCNSHNTVHVDCFLFDEEAIEDLVAEGKLTRTYCTECHSKKTKDLIFISHSLSIQQLEFIFCSLVPISSKPLGYCILDIGSRLGGVVAAAHLFSNGKAKVMSIEMNEDFCRIQVKPSLLFRGNKESLKRDFNLSSLTIISADVCQQRNVVREADLIIMNNVFVFFADVEKQKDCWLFLRSAMRPGTLLVHNPPVEHVTSHLELPFQISDWLKPIKIEAKVANFAGADEDLLSECAMLSMYEVI